MQSVELLALATALRMNPAAAARVADNLESMAAEAAEMEAQPVPAGLREAPRASH
jgi:hypothetical protein